MNNIMLFYNPPGLEDAIFDVPLGKDLFSQQPLSRDHS